jgi:outer membrane protein OmpA-like peptidoglycan-associated protein
MSKDIFGKKEGLHAASEEHWIPLSDLMSGLMMMFMLVAIIFMIQTEAEKKKAQDQADRMKQIAVIYDEMRERIYQELLSEFKFDLPKWDAELDRDLAVRFKEPDVLFESGKSELKLRFKQILDDFFPRYVRILSGRAYRSSIEEIRIEGHTSSLWITTASPELAYLSNMELSQSRTRSVLQYVLALPKSSDLKPWLMGNLTANGLSSSKPRLNKDGTEDQNASRRVEFRVRTNADSRIADVLKAAQQ